MKILRESATFVWAIALVVGFILLAYGGWRLERWWNWKWGYEDSAASQVKAEVEPLKREIQELRERVERLEGKRPEPERRP